MAKKKFQVIKADTGDYKGIVHEGKPYRFGYNDTFTISDEGLAREFDAEYGKKGKQKVAITPYSDHTTHETGHRYTFGAFSSQQARENYDNIFRKKRKGGATKARR